MGVLSNKCGFQLQYQMIFSIWLLAFSPQMCEYLRHYNIIPVLSDILQESVKEKVTRIILAAFRVSVLWDSFHFVFGSDLVVLVGYSCFCAQELFLLGLGDHMNSGGQTLVSCIQGKRHTCHVISLAASWAY